jgi:hypothetical protein
MILTKKIKQATNRALKPETRLIVYEGAAQNGKTSAALLAFGLRVANSDSELHALVAKDLDAIRDNLLEGDNKFLHLFGENAKVVGGDMGSRYIRFKTTKGDKKILLVGYSNKKHLDKNPREEHRVLPNRRNKHRRPNIHIRDICETVLIRTSISPLPH